MIWIEWYILREKSEGTKRVSLLVIVVPIPLIFEISKSSKVARAKLFLDGVFISINFPAVTVTPLCCRSESSSASIDKSATTTSVATVGCYNSNAFGTT